MAQTQHPGAAPPVSVILPTYNRAATLGRAIASVLAQTWQELELLVVDDGSSDGTDALVGAIRDPRLRYLPMPKNGGVSAARNHGLRQARGRLVALQDSDDEWLPDFLEKQIAALQQAGADAAIVMCFSHCPEDAEFSYAAMPDQPGVFDSGELLLRRLPPAPCWLARREALLRAGLFDEQINCFEDWELALRVSEFARIAMLNEALQIHHHTPGGLYSDHPGHARNLKRILARHSAKWARQPADLSMYQNVVGHMSCLHGEMGEGRRWFRMAIATCPRRPRPWLAYLISLGGRRLYRAITGQVRRRRRARLNGARSA